MYNDVTGIILAGGKSTRMGENKAFLRIGSKTLLEYSVTLMKLLFKDIMLITNSPEEYEFFNIETYKDIYPYKGPLSGIHSGLVHSNTVRNFIISCDIPLISKELISFISDFKTNKPVVVVKANGYIQQLCGIYKKEVLTAAEKLLKEDKGEYGKSQCKVLSLIDKTGAEIIDSSEISFFKKNMFLNVNRPIDYEKVLQILKIN